jgi:NMD protein affecting ribosome stability and mRNA decay
LNWSFKASTIATSKLLAKYADQGKTMVYRVAYLVRLYSISKPLVINYDQIGINLIPTGKSRIWETKRTRHIHVIGIEDKRAIKTVVSSFATRSFVHVDYFY